MNGTKRLKADKSRVYHASIKVVYILKIPPLKLILPRCLKGISVYFMNRTKRLKADKSCVYHARHACHSSNVLSTRIILQYKYIMQDMHVILTFKRTFQQTFKRTFKCICSYQRGQYTKTLH